VCVAKQVEGGWNALLSYILLHSSTSHLPTERFERCKLSKIKKRLPKLTTADAAGFAAEAWCASGYPEVPAYAKTRTRGLISQAPAGITRPPLPHRCTSGPATVPAETFSEGGAERKSNVRG
jgi:hypothetical protein